MNTVVPVKDLIMYQSISVMTDHNNKLPVMLQYQHRFFTSVFAALHHEAYTAL